PSRDRARPAPARLVTLRKLAENSARCRLRLWLWLRLRLRLGQRRRERRGLFGRLFDGLAVGYVQDIADAHAVRVGLELRVGVEQLREGYAVGLGDLFEGLTCIDRVCHRASFCSG